MWAGPPALDEPDPLTEAADEADSIDLNPPRSTLFSID
jgi:hypothetical protein